MNSFVANCIASSVVCVLLSLLSKLEANSVDASFFKGSFRESRQKFEIVSSRLLSQFARACLTVLSSISK